LPRIPLCFIRATLLKGYDAKCTNVMWSDLEPDSEVQINLVIGEGRSLRDPTARLFQLDHPQAGKKGKILADVLNIPPHPLGQLPHRTGRMFHDGP